jgi:hypothetical protein
LQILRNVVNHETIYLYTNCSNIPYGEIVNHFELDDDDIYRNTQVFEELFKFTKLVWGDDLSILKKLEELGNFDLQSWFAKGSDGEISVGVELNESSDHRSSSVMRLVF